MATDPSAGDQGGAGVGLARRRVLRLLAGGSGLALAGMTGVPIGAYLRPAPPTRAPATTVLRAGDVGLWDAVPVVVAGRPALVVNTGQGHCAFSAVCSHLGCVVKWRRSRRHFVCPCHGARFGLDGRVMGGPARRPLAPLEVVEADGTIAVRKA